MGDTPTNTSGGTTTSFMNTPQAKDDSYAYIEDVLRANSTLYNSATNTLTVDVMANDLGGAAKSLFSVEDGDGNPLTADYELLSKDVNAAGVSPWELTKNGNWVRINNGKIEYRIADGSGIPGQGVSIDSLNAGQTFNDEFVYAIRLGNGTLSEATVKISITGQNDQASIVAAPQGDYSVSEAGVHPGNTSFAGDSSAGGRLVVTDADTGQAKFQTPPASALSGTYGSFTFDANTGQWTYALDNSRAATQQLSQGQAVTETLTVTSLDGTATHSIVVNVTGTNDAPVITSSAQSGSVQEDVQLTASGQVTSSDADHGATAAYSGNASGTYGSFAVNSSTGEWTYTLDNAAHQNLAAGESHVETFTVTVTDDKGATATQNVAITVTGTNDVVTITSGPQAETVVEDTTASASGAVSFSDVDLSDGHVVSFAAAGNATSLGTFALGPVSEAANAASGSVGWTYTIDNSAAQYLAAGQSVTETYAVTVDDGHGSAATQNVTVTITGTNDAPTITSSAQSGAVTEKAEPDEGGSLTSSGTITFHDVDVNDTHSAWVLPTVRDADGNVVASPLGTLTLGGVNQSGDSVGWTYTVADGALDYLTAGQTLTQVYTVQVSDGHGGTATQNVTITITGTNDAPDIKLVGSDSASDSLTETNAGLTASGTLTVYDVDTLDTVNVSVTGVTVGGTGGAGSITNDDLLAMLSLTGNSANVADGSASSLGWHFDSGSQAFNHLATGETLVLTYTLGADDGHSGTDSQTVTITIAGTNDGPVFTGGPTYGTVQEDSSSQSTFTGTLTFADVDTSDAHTASVAAASTNTTSLGNLQIYPVQEGAGSATGTVAYRYFINNAAAQSLAQGQSVTEHYVITIDDGHGGTATQTIAIQISGTNDAPDIRVVSGDSATANLTESNAGLTASGTLTVYDVDTLDTVDVSVTGVTVGGTGGAGSITNDDLLAMLSLTGNSANAADATSGSLGWTFDSGSQAFNHLATGETLELTYTLAADDGHSGSDTQTVTITITGTNDGPVFTGGPTSGGVREDSSSQSTFTGTLTFADVDTSDAHTASVAAASTNTTSLGNLQIYPVQEGAGSATGTVAYRYFIDNAAAQSLAQGQSVTEQYDITIDDGHGGTATQTVTITITGTNDAPDIKLVAGDSPTASLTETNAGLAASGTLTVHDVDTLDTVDVTVTGVTVGGTGGAGSITNDDLLAMLSLTGNSANAADGTAGSLGWHFDSGSQAFDHLAAGQTLVLTYTLGAQDGHSGSDTQTVTITVTGTNDAPVVASAIADQSSAEDAAWSFTVPAGTFTDVDTASLSYSASLADGSALPSWLSFDPVTGTFSGTPPQDFNGAIDVKVTASDGSASASDVFTLTITPVNDAPVNTLPSSFAGTEDTQLKLAGLAVADVDSGSGAISVTLAVSSGTLSATSGGGVTVTGSGTGSLVLSGTVAAINAYLASSSSQPVFSPAANANGAVTLTMTTSDGGNTGSGGAQSDVDTSTINVAAVNDAPTSAGASGTTNEDTALNGTLPAASDVDGDLVGYALGTQASHGTAVVNADGTFSYTPVANFNGSDSFTFTVSDGQGGSNSYTYSVTVNPVNDAPVAGDDAASTNEDASVTLTAASLLANDSDADVATNGQMLSITAVSNGAHGTAVLNPDGSITYTPNGNYNGTDTITYTVSDGNGDTDTADVTITVNAVNDAPVNTVPGAQSVNEDAVLAFTGAKAMTVGDIDGDSLTTTLSVAHGTLNVSSVAGLSITGNGSGTVVLGGTQAQINAALAGLTYAGAANYNGSDTLSVTTSDGSLTDTDTVAITVNPVNDGPVATPVTLAAIAEDSGARVITQAQLLAGASDIDSAALTVTALSIASGNGSLVANSDGTWTYTPAANDDTAVTFNYTVSDGSLTASSTASLDITPVNDAPVITSNGGGATASVSVAENSTAVTTVAATDVESGTITYSIAGGADAALFTINSSTGALSFVSAPNFESPTDAGANNVYDVIVQASDGSGGTDTQSIAITVTNVNTAPVISSNGGGASAAISIAENSTAVTTVTANDDGENANTITYSIAGGADAALFTIDASTGALSFISAPNYEAPSDSGANNVYDVIVQASDGTLTDTQAIAVTVTDVNEATTAVADTLLISSGTTGAFSTDILTGNDTTQLRVTSMSGAAVTAGALTFDASSQSFVYDSTKGVGAGAQSFTYTLSDGSSATVSFVVVNGNASNFSIASAYSGSYQGSFIDLGGGPDTGTGGTAPDVLIGGDGRDTLNGGDGSDILRGGLDNDTLDGQGGLGNFDLIDFSDATTGGLTFTLVQSSSDTVFNASAAGLGTDTYRNMEGVIGTNFTDTLNGSSLGDVLKGGGGNDTINGNGGDDFIYGGAGNDALNGGAGNDTFVYEGTSLGTDTITGFVSGSDKIDLTAYGITFADVHSSVASGNLNLAIDTDHNGTSDLLINLNGVTSIASGDFIF